MRGDWRDEARRFEDIDKAVMSRQVPDIAGMETAEARSKAFAEAFEAMREALQTAAVSHDSIYDPLAKEIRTALALADKVGPATPVCDAQDHSTEAEYLACRICHPSKPDSSRYAEHVKNGATWKEKL